MVITFPHYQNITALDVPNENLLGVFQPPILPAVSPAEAVITDGLKHPIDSPSIGELASPGQRVVILCDDNTRPTRVDLILPHILNELKQVGIIHKDIRILMALGTHRPMSNAELGKKLGPEICAQYQVSNHDWDNPKILQYIGDTGSGIQVWINRLVVEADLVIGVGHIAPHADIGFSGGCKIILPGVCGTETTVQMHLASYWQKQSRPLLGEVETPIRKLIDEVGLKAGLRFIVNSVQDSSGRLVQVVTGHPIKAHRLGVATSRKLYEVAVPSLADIVIVDSYPADLDLWQAMKGFVAALRVIRPQGVIILVSPCPEGVSMEHASMVELFSHEPNELIRLVEDHKHIDRMAVLGALEHALSLSHVKSILVSPGVRSGEALALGMMHTTDPSDALTIAMEMTGRDPRILVLHQGGEILPVVREEGTSI